MQSHKFARLTAGLLLVSALITPAFATQGVVSADGSSLRVRAESNTRSAILDMLADGTRVEVLDTVADGGWYKIAHGSVTGYVSADYLRVEEDTTPKADPNGVYVRVDCDTLNVRSGPSTDHKKVGAVHSGQVLQVLEETNGWYKFKDGYVCAKYTAAATAADYEAVTDGQAVADYAKRFVGTPYVYGGCSERGFDCSGFTKYVYSHFGYTLNRTASGQLEHGVSVAKSELKPGDLVMFKTERSSNAATHVGIYLGDNKFVHASTPSTGVIISSLSKAYYVNTYVGARRIL